MRFWVWFYGVFLQGSGGGSFSIMKGGKMYDLKLWAVNHALVKAIQLNAACRRMVGTKSDVHEDLVDMDREVRQAAAECQRVLALMKADADRPLISGEAR